MTKHEIENRLSEAFENSTPEVYDKVIDRIDSENEASNIISLDSARKKKKKHPMRAVASIAAVFAIVFGLYYGSGYLKTAASVSIDVNPSIEMKINSHDRIISCIAANEDGNKILDGMDLKGTDIDVAVNALIGSMLKNGYLSDLKNSVLITVMDAENADELREKLSVEVSDLLNASIGSSAVISQTLSHDTSVEAIANQYGISQGKAALIKELTTADNTLDAAQLAALPVNDLNLLSSTRKSESTSISTVGEASSKAYIGADGAKAAALAIHPGALITEIEIDCYNGKMVYEIELVSNSIKYELEIDAVSGECIGSKSEKAEKDDYEVDDDIDKDIDDVFNDDDDDDNDDAREAAEESSAFASAAITSDGAVEIALADAGFTLDEVTALKAEQDTDDGKPVYKIEFKQGRREFEYEIDAVTGDILEKD